MKKQTASAAGRNRDIKNKKSSAKPVRGSRDKTSFRQADTTRKQDKEQPFDRFDKREAKAGTGRTAGQEPEVRFSSRRKEDAAKKSVRRPERDRIPAPGKRKFDGAGRFKEKYGHAEYADATNGPKEQPSFSRSLEEDKKTTFRKPLKTKRGRGNDESLFKEKRTAGDKKRSIKKGWSEEGDNGAFPADTSEPMMLNKYVAHSGMCGRREAAELVKQGKVRVNGVLVLEPGHRVQPGDKVTVAGKKITPQKNHVYVLLNKPKGFITTTDDPKGRKTVMDLVANSGFDRLYPVGRLDRSTTGLLLLTNDGELAQKLSHPKYEAKKVYHVTLNKPLTLADFDRAMTGLTLEDGPVKIDSMAYLENKHELGLEIHSGRNRIVRRIFEYMGYEVEKLDRVMYAGLTKKNIPRGKWRLLSEREVVLLKHFKS